MLDSLFSFLQSLLPESWFHTVQENYGFSLSDSDIIQSVHDASTFFHIDDPFIIQEDYTTGVYTNIAESTYDDILVYNRDQMEHMGITEKEGFDLVMTHEGAHRALQGLDTGYTSHQEELCCDYMAGIRAGLNGMDASVLEDALGDTEESASHPAGHLRVEAIGEGIAFAQDYMAEHGVAPTFNECLTHFNEIEGIDEVGDKPMITLRQEDDPSHLSVTREDVNHLEEKAQGIEREVKSDTLKDFYLCATRHGCQGATDCNYSYGDYHR